VRSVAIILTCFNRRDMTLACLDRLAAQSVKAPLIDEGSAAPVAGLHIFLVDDGSTDGTGDAVRAAHPEVHVIDGTGDLFWNRGMHCGWQAAIDHGGFDYYFLLNDDTILTPDALEHLITAADNPEDGSVGPGVAVGATADPETGLLTYGGYVGDSRWNRLKLQHRPLSGRTPIVTMNCNAVLVPSAVVERIGQMDPAFHHSWGDIDLGYRASKAGFVLSVPPVPIGYCESNPQGTDGHRNPELTLWERIAFINSIRGLNRADWFLLCRRHGGAVWPLVWLSPYVNLVVVWARQRTAAALGRGG
jgi:GT2 family glycosyltransferase